MNKTPRVRAADCGKQCFVKFTSIHGRDTWENVGAIIVGVDSRGKVTIKMPAGEMVAVDDINVRVFEPRPVSR